MAKRTANTKPAAAAANTEPAQAAGFNITGVLTEVYVGKKACYASIRVDHAHDDYYDLYKVKFDLDTDFPDDGAAVSVLGTMSTFKKEVNFTGTYIQPVSNS